MFCQLSWKKRTDRSLDFSGGNCGSFVVMGQSRSFSSDAFEKIVDEGVHDAHGLGGDTSVGVNLLQNLVNVDGVRFLPSFVILASRLSTSTFSFGDCLRGFSGFLGCLVWC